MQIVGNRLIILGVVVIVFMVLLGVYEKRREINDSRRLLESVAPSVSKMNLKEMVPTLAGPGHLQFPSSEIPRISGIEMDINIQIFVKDGVSVGLYCGTGARNGYIYLLEGRTLSDLDLDDTSMTEISRGFYKFSVTD